VLSRRFNILQNKILYLQAQITIDGKQAYLGLFDSEEEAARKVDEHAAGLGRPSNFASVGKKKVASSPAAVTSPSNTAPPRDPAPQSKYRGVSWIRANQKWKVSSHFLIIFQTHRVRHSSSHHLCGSTTGADHH
jgi:hypothetical protein